MLEQKVRILSEGLARSMDRRKFLKQTGSTLFAGMAALALGQVTNLRTASALTPPQCIPPGPYCNLNGVNEPNGCHGGSCYQHRYNNQVLQCRVWYCCYQVGCWTTPVSGGYWVCCDCECGIPPNWKMTTCGCAQFSAKPVPRPDSPVAGSDS